MVTHKEGFSLFQLFGVVSGMFQPRLNCYSLCWVVPFFTSNSVTECFEFQIYYKSTSFRIYYKGVQRYFKMGQLKVGEVLQSGAGIRKRGNLCYRMGQLLQSSWYRKQMRKTEEGNRFWQLRFCYNQKKEEITPPPQVYLHD